MGVGVGGRAGVNGQLGEVHRGEDLWSGPGG